METSTPAKPLRNRLLKLNEQEIIRLARSESTSWWIRGRRAIVRTALQGYVPPTSSFVVADLGCGAGGMFDVLKEYGAVVGFDISPLAATLCRAKGYAGAAVGTLEHLPVRPGALDLAAVTDVLEHVDDDEKVLRECWRALRPRGIVLVTVPASPWLFGEHDRALGHLRRYSRRGIERLLSLCGFQVERITYFNTLLFPVAAMIRFLSATSRKVRPQADPLDLAPPLNWLAYRLLLAERSLIQLSNLPFGLSLLCLGRKPPEERRDDG